jgi:hypothetical protein
MRNIIKPFALFAEMGKMCRNREEPKMDSMDRRDMRCQSIWINLLNVVGAKIIRA